MGTALQTVEIKTARPARCFKDSMGKKYKLMKVSKETNIGVQNAEIQRLRNRERKDDKVLKRNTNFTTEEGSISFKSVADHCSYRRQFDFHASVIAHEAEFGPRKCGS